MDWHDLRFDASAHYGIVLNNCYQVLIHEPPSGK
jgi:hypothetical protein